MIRSLKRSSASVVHGLPCFPLHEQRFPRALGTTTAWHWLHSLTPSQAPASRTRALHRPRMRISCRLLLGILLQITSIDCLHDCYIVGERTTWSEKFLAMRNKSSMMNIDKLVSCKDIIFDWINSWLVAVEEILVKLLDTMWIENM